MNSDDEGLSEDQRRQIEKERTGESRDKGLKTNGDPKTSGEQSWRLARCGRFRVNGVRV
jgi:hypothetical protein